MPQKSTERRKDEHIDINVEQDVSFDQKTTGLENYSFTHAALPELNLYNIDTQTTLFQHTLRFPLLIASVTGGSKKTCKINQLLAETAQAYGLAMGLGSMRAAIDDPAVEDTFKVRTYAPDILLFANLGAVQLNYGYGLDECLKAVTIVEADGLILHLNPLQEALQPEGNVRFQDLLRKIEAICTSLPVPVIVKEVGFGLSQKVAKKLIDAGVSALDIAGAGGTSWSQVEMYRAENWVQRTVASSFRDWGIPTVESLVQVRKIAPDIPVIASGGLQTGIDIAKVIALGADIASIAGPILRFAVNEPDHLVDYIAVLEKQLRITMFVTGAATIQALQSIPLVFSDK